MGTIFRAFIEFVTILLLCHVLVFWPGGVGSYLPHQGSNQYPLHWKVKSTTGPPGKSQGVWFSDEDWKPPWVPRPSGDGMVNAKGWSGWAAGLLDLLKFSLSPTLTVIIS